MQPLIDHIHITVRDLDRAEGFYDALLPLLGFDLSLKERTHEPDYDYRLVEYHHSAFSLGLVSPRGQYAGEPSGRRRPGALHHLAFQADSRGGVDGLFARVSALPAEIVHPPRLYPEYCGDYYAFFFKDPEGIELEIVHFDRPGCF